MCATGYAMALDWLPQLFSWKRVIFSKSSLCFSLSLLPLRRKGAELRYSIGVRLHTLYIQTVEPPVGQVPNAYETEESFFGSKFGQNRNEGECFSLSTFEIDHWTTISTHPYKTALPIGAKGGCDMVRMRAHEQENAKMT